MRQRGATVPHGRRAFLRQGSLILSAAALEATALDRLVAQDEGSQKGVRVGLVTDLHYADKPPAGTRHHRETLDKLAEAATQFAEDRPAFVVELGDLIDAADSVETERAYLEAVNKHFSAISKERHYVLGNH